MPSHGVKHSAGTGTVTGSSESTLEDPEGTNEQWLEVAVAILEGRGCRLAITTRLRAL